MATTRGVTTPREIIERIRTEDYLLDIEEESDRVRRGAKSLHKKLNWNSPAFPDTSIMPKWQQEVWNGNQGETEFHA